MANPRVFGFQSSSGTAQPLIGTTLANAITPCAVNSSYLGTAGQNVQVANSGIFVVGDYVNIVPQAGATTPAAEIQVRIGAIPDGSHIVILNSQPHNSGDWVVLYWPCAQIRIQENKASAPAGSLFVGSDSTVGTSGANSFTDLSVDFTFVSPIRPDNSDSPSNYWIISSSGSSQYLPSLWQA